MITDPLWYRLFKISPETFFLLFGMTIEEAQRIAACYRFEALEFKETAYRSDGVFLPRDPKLPVYFLEVQFQRSLQVFADVCVKAFTYLKQHDPLQDFCGVVLFASRVLRPKKLGLYKNLVKIGLLRYFYLDELPEPAQAPLGWSILKLIGQPVSEAPVTARAMLARCRTEIADARLQANLIQLIETIILYKLPKLTREEIQAMLQVQDIRQTRIYQEALEEGKEMGLKEGLEKGKEEGIAAERRRQLKQERRSIAKLAARKIAAKDIAEILGLDVELVRKELAKKRS
jgi:predicted transposase/invertase (TIGR01784 family)